METDAVSHRQRQLIADANRTASANVLQVSASVLLPRNPSPPLPDVNVNLEARANAHLANASVAVDLVDVAKSASTTRFRTC